MRPHRVLGNSIILQRAMREPAWRKLNSAAQLLMPLELSHKQNRVAIVNSIFNPSKYWTVTIQPFLKDTHLFSACVVYCQFLCRLFHSVLCSIQCFLFDYSVFDYLVSDYSVYFLFWYWNCIPGISIPLFTDNNQPAVYKHHTATALSLSLYRKWEAY